MSDNLKRLENFVDFAFVPYDCLPGGLAVWNDVLYVSCGAFVGSNVSILEHLLIRSKRITKVTYPMLKFSLDRADYGTHLIF